MITGAMIIIPSLALFTREDKNNVLGGEFESNGVKP